MNRENVDNSVTIRERCKKQGEARTMEQGKVKWYNESKGYGFIEKESDGKDIFVHVSGIMRESGFFALKENDRVAFEIANGEKGPKAVGVRRL